MNSLREHGSVVIAGAILVALLGLSACSGGVATQSTTNPVRSPADYGLEAVLWYQTSGEARALYYQAYRLARYVLDDALTQGATKPPAVVVDIDETVLDNSPYEAQLLKEGAHFTNASFKAWIALSEARPLPGAVAFLSHADSLGVAIFYVTNRDSNDAEPTLHNLELAGFPQASREHLYPRVAESSKERRRKMIEQKYAIVLLMGDNLNDFTGMDGLSVEERDARTDSLSGLFGTKFIALPNPMYGDWERALYNYKSVGDSAREETRYSRLRGYDR
jgi:5'-nucleotidase (lipoprotein e(P4) family)